MNKNSLRGMLAAVAVVATCGLAYAAPSPTISVTWPQGAQTVDCLSSMGLEIEWSSPVYVDSEKVVNVRGGISQVTGHFAPVEGPTQSTQLMLSQDITEPGSYNIVLPEGIVYDGETLETSGATNEQTILKYIIEEAQGGDEGDEPGVMSTFTLISSDPASGTTVKELSIIDTFWSPKVVGTEAGKALPVTNASGVEVTTATLDIDGTDWDNYNKIQLILGLKITEEGTYKIVIPAGAIYEDNDGTKVGENEETVLTYTIGEGGGSTVTPTGGFQPIGVYPETDKVINMQENDGVSNLSAVNLQFENAPYVKEGYEFVFTNENGEEFKSALDYGGDEPENYMIMNLDGHVIIVGIPGKIATGTYTLSVPAGVIGDKTWANSNYTKGNCNEAFTYTWKYIAKEVVEVPKEVIDEPLVIELLTMTADDVTYNLLDPDTEVASFPANAIFNIKTNKDEYAGSLYLTLSEIRGEVVDVLWVVGTLPSASIGMKDEEGVFVFRKASTNILYSDAEYIFEIKAYVNFEVPESERTYLQSAEVKIKGLTEPIAYSDADIEDVIPASQSIIKSYEENTFTVYYDQPVEIVASKNLVYDGLGMSSGVSVKYEGIYPYASITPNEDKTAWTFAIPVDQLEAAKGEVICIVVANDMEGKRVYPHLYPENSGTGDQACQMYYYACYLGCPAVTVVPGEGAVKELYEFEFTCPEAAGGAIGYSGITAEGKLAICAVYKADDMETPIATIDRNDYKEIDNGKEQRLEVIKLIMHLDKAVTEPGDYVLYIEPGFFLTGSEYDSYTNCPQYIKYTVTSESGINETLNEGVRVSAGNGKITVCGAEGIVEVYSISGAKLATVNAESGVATFALEKGIYVVVVNGMSVKVVL